MAVTGQIGVRTGFGETIIQNWKTAGLIKPSAIKPVIFTVEKKMILKVLGGFGKKDQENLRAVIETVIG